MATTEQLYNHLKTLTSQWFNTKEEISVLLDDKVDVESGKGLSEENFTSTLKNKLDNIESEANKTIVDSSFVSNSTNPVQSKVVKSALDAKANSADLHAVSTSGSYLDLENVPETFAPSSHEHSAGEVKDSNAYANLGTSANATQSAINYAINSRIGSLLSVELIEVTSTRPTASASTMNKLYLVPESTSQSNDAYEVFVTVRTIVDDEGDEVEYSYVWEKIDTARIDLTNYVTTDDSRLSDARTPTSHTHGNITNDGKIGSDAGKMVVTTTNGVLTTSDIVSEMDSAIQQLITYGNSLNSE